MQTKQASKTYRKKQQCNRLNRFRLVCKKTPPNWPSQYAQYSQLHHTALTSTNFLSKYRVGTLLTCHHVYTRYRPANAVAGAIFVAFQAG